MSFLKENGKVNGNSTQLVFKINKKIGSLITILAFILSDDGVVDRGNREALLSTDFDNFGLGGMENDEDFYLTILIVDSYEPTKTHKYEVSKY